jgi:hypothetical protein
MMAATVALGFHRVFMTEIITWPVETQFRARIDRASLRFTFDRFCTTIGLAAGTGSAATQPKSKRNDGDKP